MCSVESRIVVRLNYQTKYKQHNLTQPIKPDLPNLNYQTQGGGLNLN